MLERPGLVLCNWTTQAHLPVDRQRLAGGRELARVRPIFDLPTRRFLGFVSGSRLMRQPLFARSALEIYETEDVSLLCTVYRPWLFSWTWDVFDAEERHVGMVHRGMLFDGAATRLGIMNLSSAGERGVFIDPQGLIMATVEIREEEVDLSFCASVDGQPFLRMLVLAAVIASADRLLLNRKRVALIHPATGVQPC